MDDPSLPGKAPDSGIPNPGTPSRRKVMGLAAAGAVGAAAGAASPWAFNQVLGTRQPRKWHFLTEAEAALLDSVCEQIIPGDQDPGARDAGCVHFIDRQLVGHYRSLQRDYREGLAALQALAHHLEKQDFEKLPFDVQTGILSQMEGNRVKRELWEAPNVSPNALFQLLRDHTMQGFYGSPRHGGNKGYASYHMLGLEYPRVIGRNRPVG